MLMNLGAWSWSRVALAWACYIVLVGALAAGPIVLDRWRLTREHTEPHFVVAYAVEVHPAAVVVLVPPVILTAAWFWLRRRR